MERACAWIARQLNQTLSGNTWNSNSFRCLIWSNLINQAHGSTWECCTFYCWYQPCSHHGLGLRWLLLPSVCLLAFCTRCLSVHSAAVAFVLHASPSTLFSSSPFVVPVAFACMLIVCSQWTGWFLWLVLIPWWILILLYKYKNRKRECLWTTVARYLVI